jgi:hypothetical protein
MSNVVRSDQSRRGSGAVDAGANKNENVTVVFADVEAISHSDITSTGEEVQRAGNQTCRGDSLDVDVPEIRTGWLGHAGTAGDMRIKGHSSRTGCAAGL